MNGLKRCTFKQIQASIKVFLNSEWWGHLVSIELSVHVENRGEKDYFSLRMKIEHTGEETTLCPGSSFSHCALFLYAFFLKPEYSWYSSELSHEFFKQNTDK